MAKLDKQLFIQKAQMKDKVKAYKVESLDEKVFIKKLSAREATDLSKGSIDANGRPKADPEATYKMIIACVCDEVGTPMFTKADMGLFDEFEVNIIQELMKIINEHCGFGMTKDKAEKN